MFDFSDIISKISYEKSQPTINAAVMYRGQPLGKWTGTSFEFSELQHRLTGTGIQLMVVKE